MYYLRLIIYYLVLSTCFLSVTYPKDDIKTKLPQELQDKVNEMVERGITALLSSTPLLSDHSFNQLGYRNVTHIMRYEEIVLYTLAHCGVAMKNEFNSLLKDVLELPLDRTYHVALQAMALEAIDRIKYQARIADCAQFLVDNQCANGQWDYGLETPSKHWKKVYTGGKNIKGIITDGKNTSDAKSQDTQVRPDKSTQTQKIGAYKITRTKPGRPAGDNSNTQYALLGLRACKEAYIDIQPETFRLAKSWLENNQGPDGGWMYSPLNEKDSSESYGSMTAGGLGSLYIVKFFLNEIKPGQQDKSTEKAINWLIKNYTVSNNPRTDRQQHFYYYLYALERAGILSGYEKFGNNNWYLDGCRELTAKQEWTNISDICFALLFLKRATKPLKTVITPK